MGRPYVKFVHGDPPKAYIMTQAQADVPEPAWGMIENYPQRRAWRISFVTVTQEDGGGARSNFYVESADDTDTAMGWAQCLEALTAAMAIHIGPRSREWVVQVQVTRVSEESVLQRPLAPRDASYPPAIEDAPDEEAADPEDFGV